MNDKQEHVDGLYRILDRRMSDERIFRDGEATYREAALSFNKNLLIAEQIHKGYGLLPSFDGDVFFVGKLPSPMKLEDKVWEERHQKLTVHCLKCDDIYLETDPPVEVCPHCGNPDKQKTVYFQGETI